MAAVKRNKIAKELEKKARLDDDRKYVLRLYVTGSTPKSMRAVRNIKEICEEHLKGRYELEVIDIYNNPILSRGDQILAAPTLIKKLPLPLRKLIGDMSDTEKVLLGLELKPKKKGRSKDE